MQSIVTCAIGNIRSYPRSVLRYKFLILHSRHPDTIFTRARMSRSAVIFRIQKEVCKQKSLENTGLVDTVATLRLENRGNVVWFLAGAKDFLLQNLQTACRPSQRLLKQIPATLSSGKGGPKADLLTSPNAAVNGSILAYRTMHSCCARCQMYLYIIKNNLRTTGNKIAWVCRYFYMGPKQNEQDRQNTYNVPMRRISAIVVAVEKQ